MKNNIKFWCGYFDINNYLFLEALKFEKMSEKV